ncbi:hypothetical protein [Methylobacterium sp. CM6246]
MQIHNTASAAPHPRPQLGPVSTAIATMRGPEPDREAIRSLRAALIRQIAADLDTIDRLDAITTRLAHR